MSQEKEQKEQLQEETSHHFFLNYLNKKQRNLNKKLRDIETLENLQELNQAQKKKIEGKDSLKSQYAEFEEIRKHFHLAEQEAGLETTLPKKKEHKPKKEKKQQPVQKKEEIEAEIKEVNQVKEAKDKHPMVKPTLNLAHLAKILRKEGPEFKKNLEKPELYDVILDFHDSIFEITKAPSTKYIIKLNLCYHALNKYLNNSEEVALQTHTYNEIYEIVENFFKSPFFHNYLCPQDKIEELQKTDTPKQEPKPVEKEEKKEAQAQPQPQVQLQSQAQPQPQAEPPVQVLVSQEKEKVPEKESSPPVAEKEKVTHAPAVEHLEAKPAEKENAQEKHVEKHVPEKRGEKHRHHPKRSPPPKEEEEDYGPEGKFQEEGEDGFIVVKKKAPKHQQHGSGPHRGGRWRKVGGPSQGGPRPENRGEGRVESRPVEGKPESRPEKVREEEGEREEKEEKRKERKEEPREREEGQGEKRKVERRRGGGSRGQQGYTVEYVVKEEK